MEESTEQETAAKPAAKPSTIIPASSNFVILWIVILLGINGFLLFQVNQLKAENKEQSKRIQDVMVGYAKVEIKSVQKESESLDRDEILKANILNNKEQIKEFESDISNLNSAFVEFEESTTGDIKLINNRMEVNSEMISGFFKKISSIHEDLAELKRSSPAP